MSAVVRAITGQPLDVHGACQAERDVVNVVHGVADDDDELEDFDDYLPDVKAVNDVALLHMDTELLHLQKEDEMIHSEYLGSVPKPSELPCCLLPI